MKEQYEICPISVKIIQERWIANFVFTVGGGTQSISL